ncbi:MAG: folate-binding protein [Methylophilaceae bacterium]|nr:MAG: folate-binding protein [Methylophilaceae bacterium]
MQQWQQFLQDSSSHPLVLDNKKILSFGDSHAEIQATKSSNVICDLSHLGLLQIQGEDAITFLQGQVTNDVKQLDGHLAHYTAYCSPKGRMLALFLAFAHYDHMHLQLPIELVASIAKRLKMYVMRSKVEIIDVSESIIKIGLSGQNAADLLKPHFSTIPKTDYELVSLENGAVLKLSGTLPRYEIFTDLNSAKLIWNDLCQHTTAVGAPCWDWLEIQAGIPEVTLNTQEQFVPQMLNLDLLGAINFKKGCYTGQEIVARTHYLGTVKRRTYLAQLNSKEQPKAGDEVFNDAGEAVGKVVRSAITAMDSYDLLVEIRLERVESGKVFIDGIALAIKPLPYPIQANK